jgi:AraC-like DNA-binding protein
VVGGEILRAHIPTLDELSEKLHMSTSTLRRRLSARNNNYQNILNEIRCDLASEYLQHSQMPVEKISDLLGYSDPGNFSHAFKNWTGESPRNWRQLKQLG